MILATKDVLKKLRISKAGLYKWIKAGKITQRTYRWGGRVYKGFKDTEIDELAKRIDKKGWKRGKSLIDKSRKTSPNLPRPQS
jgi:predicted site-specific integrase-resolvase